MISNEYAPRNRKILAYRNFALTNITGHGTIGIEIIGWKAKRRRDSASSCLVFNGVGDEAASIS